LDIYRGVGVGAWVHAGFSVEVAVMCKNRKWWELKKKKVSFYDV
jgi:hypothetical protein